VQARKLYQAAYEQLENYKELQNQQLQEEKKFAEIPAIEPVFSKNLEIEEAQIVEVPEVAAPVTPVQEAIEEPEDETTLKLRKLKSLYDKQLITQEEYEAKKATILDSF
jgi:membrane-associated HD superfamily phosphohydrolase